MSYKDRRVYKYFKPKRKQLSFKHKDGWQKVFCTQCKVAFYKMPCTLKEKNYCSQECVRLSKIKYHGEKCKEKARREQCRVNMNAYRARKMEEDPTYFARYQREWKEKNMVK